MEPESLEEVRIKRVVMTPQLAGQEALGATAVLIGNDEKTFAIYIGPYEGAALIRELKDERPARPLTHDLISYVLDGFDIEIRRVILSDLIDGTYYATLVLEQKVTDDNGEWVGRRNEVRIDARPSDCLVLAQKEKRPIYCTRTLLDKVTHVSEANLPGLEDAPPFTKPDFLEQDWSDPGEFGSEDDEIV